MQNIKPFSRSLKKFINKTNPQQKEINLFFKRSTSQQKLYHPTLPVLVQRERVPSLVKHKAYSHKITTEPAQSQEQHHFQKIQARRQYTLQEDVDDIMYGLIKKGEATVQCSKQMMEQLQKKKLKNLRVVTEQAQPKPRKKKRLLQKQLQTLILQQQVQREKKVRKNYIYKNPHIQKKVNTRWQASQSKGASKQALSYYPLADIRQQNQEALLNIPASTDEYLRRLRQTIFYKGRRL